MLICIHTQDICLTMQHILFAALILHNRKLSDHMFLHHSYHQSSIWSEHKRKETTVTKSRTQTTSIFYTVQKTSKHIPNGRIFDWTWTFSAAPMSPNDYYCRKHDLWVWKACYKKGTEKQRTGEHTKLTPNEKPPCPPAPFLGWWTSHSGGPSTTFISTCHGTWEALKSLASPCSTWP